MSWCDEHECPSNVCGEHRHGSSGSGIAGDALRPIARGLTKSDPRLWLLRIAFWRIGLLAVFSLGPVYWLQQRFGYWALSIGLPAAVMFLSIESDVRKIGRHFANWEEG